MNDRQYQTGQILNNIYKQNVYKQCDIYKLYAYETNSQQIFKWYIGVYKYMRNRETMLYRHKYA